MFDRHVKANRQSEGYEAIATLIWYTDPLYRTIRIIKLETAWHVLQIQCTTTKLDILSGDFGI